MSESRLGMPTLYAIPAYRRGQVDAFPEYRAHSIVLGEPFCAACGWLAPASNGDPYSAQDWRSAGRFIQRAHLEDCDGTDNSVQNLVPLCLLCHEQMPMFDRGEREAALAWVRSKPDRHWGYQMLTDAQDWSSIRHGSIRGQLRRLYIRTLEVLASIHGEQLELWPDLPKIPSFSPSSILSIP
jgi:hypothetical protein